MAGDWVTERGFGGGPISDRGSGETESTSELSRLRGTPNPFDLGRVGFVLCASSTSSLTSLWGIREETVAFRRAGFTIGDCRIRLGALADRGALLLVLRCRLPASGWAMAASPSCMSTSISTGEAPVELPEFVYWLTWPCGCWWFWAVSAGDVSGLK
jgi:hypothetical protein